MPVLNSLFQVNVNKEIIHFSTEEINKADVIAITPFTYNVIHNGCSVNATIEAVCNNNKSLRINIAGEVFFVTIQDELEQMLHQMGFGKVVTKIIKEIKAPMPGLVVEIAVAEGAVVHQGEKLLILEAMKMENSLQASADAIIKTIHVIKGQAVVKGQVLIELE